MFYFTPKTPVLPDLTQLATVAGLDVPTPPKECMIKARDASFLLIQHSDLRHLKIFPCLDLIYLYIVDKGYYKKIRPEVLKIYISQLLVDVDKKLMEVTYVNSIYSHLRLQPEVSYDDAPQFDHEYVAFSNGLLNTRSRTFQEFSPDYFSISCLPYPWEPSRPIPLFLQFLDDITGGEEERKAFLRALFQLILIGELRYQVFFYLYGYGGTGKTLLTRIIEALVGVEGTHVTSLKSLNCDQFEILNIVDKKLVLMSDTEQYSKDLSVLKALVGEDLLRGRVMFKSGTLNIRFPGLVLIVGNQLLSARDSSNAMLRRIRPLKMDKIRPSQECLNIFQE